MLKTTRGIILQRRKFGENGFICDVLTNEHGKQGYLFKGLPSKKKKNISFHLHPLQLMDFEIYYKDGKKLTSVRNTNPYVILKDIPYNIYKSSISTFLAEVINKVVYEESYNNELYEYIENSIIYLDSAEENIPNFHLFFLIHLTKFLGFFPNNNYSEDNIYLNLSDGSFTDKKENSTTGPNTARAIYELMNTRLSKLNDIRFDREARNLLLDTIIHFYNIHHDRNISFNSLEIIREIFE